VTGTIRLQREFDATPTELWDLIATRDGLAAWLMPNDFQPVVGHRFTFTDTPRPPIYDGVVGCTVLALEPMERLQLSWVGGPVDTVVTFTLTELEPGRVRLELEHTGFSGLRASFVRAVLGLGWRSLLRRELPRTIADRRTCHGG
jgi:uncharacterized protein YndB with AHSA1/START domain